MSIAVSVPPAELATPPLTPATIRQQVARAFDRGAELHDTALGGRMINPAMERLYPIEGLGLTAENVAEQFQIAREDQDAFALRSQHKAAAAQEAGHLNDEIVAVIIQGSGDKAFCAGGDV